MSIPKLIKFRGALYTVYPTEDEPALPPSKVEEEPDPPVPQRRRSRIDSFGLKRACDRLGLLCRGGRLPGSWVVLLPDHSWKQFDSTDEAGGFLSTLG